MGPSVMDTTKKPQVQLRQAEGGEKMSRTRTGSILHRQSLPPFSVFPTKPLPEELKRPKRKSLTLIEEAWGWLENFGRSGRQQPGKDKNKCQQDDRQQDNRTTNIEKIAQTFEPLNERNETKNKTREAKQTGINLLGKLKRNEENTEMNERKDKVNEPTVLSDAVEKLRNVIIQQHAYLKELNLKTDSMNEQICKLEKPPEKAQSLESTLGPGLSEEEGQLKFWLNELKAEQGFEKDLQRQFLELKEKAAECKTKLEEYKSKLQRMDHIERRLAWGQQTIKTQEDDVECPSVHLELGEEKRDAGKRKADSEQKTQITTVESQLPYIVVTSEPQLSGPAELREWWTRWTGAQKTKQMGLRGKVIHRSEILIHLGSTRV